jgi:hypothetical protein
MNMTAEQALQNLEALRQRTAALPAAVSVASGMEHLAWAQSVQTISAFISSVRAREQEESKQEKQADTGTN